MKVEDLIFLPVKFASNRAMKESVTLIMPILHVLNTENKYIIETYILFFIMKDNILFKLTTYISEDSDWR